MNKNTEVLCEAKKIKKIAFFVGRPYQLFTSIIMSENLEDGLIDLFIENNYDNAILDYKRIAKLKIFSNVYFLKSNGRSKSFKSKLRKFFMLLSKIISKKYFIKKSLIESEFSDNFLFDKNYDEIYFSTPSAFPVTLAMIFNKSSIFIFEDGLGTYVNQIDEEISILSKIFSFITRNGIKYVKNRIKSTFLYNTDIYNNSNNISVKRIEFKTYDTNLLNKLNLVFNYLGTGIYKNSNIIILSQGESIDKDGMLDKVFNQVYDRKIDGDYLFRLHPSQKFIKSSNYIDSTDMWELVCFNEIHEKHILISIFSTAVFSPYNIFKKSPYIILLFKIVRSDYVMRNEAILIDQVNKFKAIYPNNKLYIPTNISDFREILNKIREGDCIQ